MPTKPTKPAADTTTNMIGELDAKLSRFHARMNDLELMLYSRAQPGTHGGLLAAVVYAVENADGKVAKVQFCGPTSEDAGGTVNLTVEFVP